MYHFQYLKYLSALKIQLETANMCCDIKKSKKKKKSNLYLLQSTLDEIHPQSFNLKIYL